MRPVSPQPNGVREQQWKTKLEELAEVRKVMDEKMRELVKKNDDAGEENDKLEPRHNPEKALCGVRRTSTQPEGVLQDGIYRRTAYGVRHVILYVNDLSLWPRVTWRKTYDSVGNLISEDPDCRVLAKSDLYRALPGIENPIDTRIEFGVEDEPRSIAMAGKATSSDDPRGSSEQYPDMERQMEINQEGTQGLRARIKKEPQRPSREEVEEHNATHVPFRNWCDHCVRGQCQAEPHYSKGMRKMDEQKNLVAMDYMWMIAGEEEEMNDDAKAQKEGETGDRDIDDMPILVLRDRRTNYKFAHVVPRKGEVHSATVDT